jgi:hypothetical protein
MLLVLVGKSEANVNESEFTGWHGTDVQAAGGKIELFGR